MLARLVFGLYAIPVWQSLRRPHSSLRLCHISSSKSIVTPSRWPPCRAFSVLMHHHSNIFQYTSGQWIFNNDLRHAERRRVFNVDELSRLAAESVNRSLDDIVSLEKFGEGGFNRIFLITMRCGFRMIARIPYPVTVPKYFAVASEVATMALLRSFGLPIPDVYGYSPVPNNAAGTEYIFMEFIQGTNLSDIWFDLGEREIILISQQIATLESKMMSIDFPAGGSLYYTKDLENVAGGTSGPTGPGITLGDKHFSVGPDTSLPLWYGRRSQLNLDRGPYKSAEETLVRGAEKELAYLRQFGRPLLPFQRVRRESYKYQKQVPSDHIENLERYLCIASPLIPRDPALGRFRIRHPDLRPSNIIVSRSPDSNLRIVGLIDWQHASILPLFLLAGIPQLLQNNHDTSWKSMKQPSLLEKMDETQQSGETVHYRRRPAYHHYLKSTEKCNELHYAILMDPMGMLRHHLFCDASDPWEGETLELKVALIQVMKNWKVLTGGDAPCPIVFDPDDVRKTMKLYTELRGADKSLAACQAMFGIAPDGWVPAERYEEAMARSKKLKEDALVAAESEAERAEFTAHWPFDDMDEEEYA